MSGGDELDGWEPTSAESGVLAALCELVATRDAPVWELLDMGMNRLTELLQDACIASLLSDSRWLHPLSVADTDPAAREVLERFTGTRLRADEGFGRQTLSSGRALRLTELSPEAVVATRPELAPFVERFGIRSAILAPMRARGRSLGLLAVLRRPPRASHDAHEERLVQVVADWLAVAAESAGTKERISLTAAGSAGSSDLSNRELEILALLAVGHTNREVAGRLFLSVRTVEWHRARLQAKLGVHGRAALTRRARILGVID